MGLEGGRDDKNRSKSERSVGGPVHANTDHEHGSISRYSASKIGRPVWDKYLEEGYAKLDRSNVRRLHEHPVEEALFLLTHRDQAAYSGFVEDFWDDLYGMVLQAVREEPVAFSRELRSWLDFKDPDSFATTASVLELIRNLYIDVFAEEEDMLDMVDPDGKLKTVDPERFAALTQGSDSVVAIVESAVDRGAGSYLLNARAAQVLAAIRAPHLEYEDADAEPFRIARDMYAGFNHDKSRLYIAPQQFNHKIEAYLQQDKPHKDMMHYDAFYSSVIDAGKAVDTKLFASMGLAASEQDLRDFYFLQSAPIREQIKKDFEIELAGLTLSEQFELLQFLKVVEKKDASPLLLQATRQLRKIGALRLDLIRDGSYEAVDGAQLSPPDVDTMRALHETRYEGRYPDAELQELREGLDAALASPHARFYVFRKGHEIVSFVRFEDLAASNDAAKYMGSFMTDPRFDGGALGQALLETALQAELKRGPLYAICDPSLVSFYEKFGFKLARTYTDDHGVPTCDIVLEPSPESVREAA